jgi:hypothetical protein
MAIPAEVDGLRAAGERVLGCEWIQRNHDERRCGQ